MSLFALTPLVLSVVTWMTQQNQCWIRSLIQMTWWKIQNICFINIYTHAHIDRMQGNKSVQESVVRFSDYAHSIVAPRALRVPLQCAPQVWGGILKAMFSCFQKEISSEILHPGCRLENQQRSIRRTAIRETGVSWGPHWGHPPKPHGPSQHCRMEGFKGGH